MDWARILAYVTGLVHQQVARMSDERVYARLRRAMAKSRPMANAGASSRGVASHSHRSSSLVTWSVHACE